MAADVLTTTDDGPALVEAVRARIADGVPWREVAAGLSDAGHEVLDAALQHWAAEMRHRRSDDFEGFAALRAIERAARASSPSPWRDGSR